MVEHGSVCDKCVDTSGFYGEAQFSPDCDICKTSFCTDCSKNHIHFIYCEISGYLHSAKIETGAKLWTITKMVVSIRNKKNNNNTANYYYSFLNFSHGKACRCT